MDTSDQFTPSPPDTTPGQGRHQLAETAATVKTKAADATGKAAHTVKSKADRAVHTASDPKWRDDRKMQAEEWIRRNPGRATGIAFAAGFRLGRILHKR